MIVDAARRRARSVKSAHHGVTVRRAGTPASWSRQRTGVRQVPAIGRGGMTSAPYFRPQRPARGLMRARRDAAVEAMISWVPDPQIRRLHRRRQRLLHCPARSRDRLPRSERCGQVHHDARHGGSDCTVLGLGHYRWCSFADLPNPAWEVGVPARRLGLASAAPDARSSPLPATRWACHAPGSTR